MLEDLWTLILYTVQSLGVWIYLFMMESGYVQGKKYTALKGKSLYLILGGFCLLFITVFPPEMPNIS